jgi:dual specificity MAP kinase phosphatase
MPSDSETMVEDEQTVPQQQQGVDSDWVVRQLRSDASRFVLLDCRSSIEYSECHVRSAVNLSIPSIMLRRLAAGKIDLVSTIKCRELKAKISDALKENLFVVYGDCVNADNQQLYNETLEILTRRLKQDGCQVACLNGE